MHMYTQFKCGAVIKSADNAAKQGKHQPAVFLAAKSPLRRLFTGKMSKTVVF